MLTGGPLNRERHILYRLKSLLLGQLLQHLMGNGPVQPEPSPTAVTINRKKTTFALAVRQIKKKEMAADNYFSPKPGFKKPTDTPSSERI